MKQKYVWILLLLGVTVFYIFFRVSTLTSLIVIFSFAAAFIAEQIVDSKIDESQKKIVKIAFGALQLCILIYGLNQTEQTSREEARKVRIAENDRLFKLSKYLAVISNKFLNQYNYTEFEPELVKTWLTNDFLLCSRALDDERLNTVLNSNPYLLQVWKATNDSLTHLQGWPIGNYHMPIYDGLEKASSILNNFTYYFDRYRGLNEKNKGFEYELMCPIDSALLTDLDWTTLKEQINREDSIRKVRQLE